MEWGLGAAPGRETLRGNGGQVPTGSGTQGAGVAAPPERHVSPHSSGRGGSLGPPDLTTAQGGGCPGTLQSSCPASLPTAKGNSQSPCLTRTAPRPAGGQPGKGDGSSISCPFFHLLILTSGGASCLRPPLCLSQAGGGEF